MSRHYMIVIAEIPSFTEAVLEYTRRVIDLVKRSGGEYIVRGGPLETLEGSWPTDRRLVISRWPSLEALRAFWCSEEYQSIVKPLREGTGQYHVVVYPELPEEPG